MADNCKLQCERKCQVWQLAVGGESNPTGHLHMPCLPGGGRPGGNMTFRTYEGGCRSVCSGSVRHPVQHLYPAGRMKKWFFETKEWFWDGMLVMKTENPTKSASHYCLPFPRPTMRLPRSCNSRLVEVHHVHPPPSTTEAKASDESGEGTPPQDSAKSTPTAPQFPSQGGSEAQSQAGSHIQKLDSQRSDPTESPASGVPQESSKPPVDTHPRETDGGHQKPSSGKVGRISHINVGPGSPKSNAGGQQTKGGTKHGDPPEYPGSGLTYINYRASSCCSKFCCRRCCQGPGCFPCVPVQWKFWVRRGVVWCLALMASACLCLSSTCATTSFCFRSVARSVDAVATTAVDVKDLFNCYVFVADMPGLKHSEIKVQVENDSVLKISGDRMRDDYAAATNAELKYILVERNPGRIMRKFNLPTDINLDTISAACQDGLLTVIVPKNPLADPLRPRSFDVDVHSTSVSPPQSSPLSPGNSA